MNMTTIVEAENPSRIARYISLHSQSSSLCHWTVLPLLSSITVPRVVPLTSHFSHRHRLLEMVRRRRSVRCARCLRSSLLAVSEEEDESKNREKDENRDEDGEKDELGGRGFVLFGGCF